ncbi:hypothetical protein Pelo_17715 [Pelomyxa schiedti]|nr:hypothetical protein Pelo_17715 [Pelomyxa schiedti]
MKAHLTTVSLRAPFPKCHIIQRVMQSLCRNVKHRFRVDKPVFMTILISATKTLAFPRYKTCRMMHATVPEMSAAVPEISSKVLVEKVNQQYPFAVKFLFHHAIFSLATRPDEGFVGRHLALQSM